MACFSLQGLLALCLGEKILKRFFWCHASHQTHLFTLVKAHSLITQHTHHPSMTAILCVSTMPVTGGWFMYVRVVDDGRCSSSSEPSTIKLVLSNCLIAPQRARRLGERGEPLLGGHRDVDANGADANADNRADARTARSRIVTDVHICGRAMLETDI